MMRMPNFLIIGAAKSGTTALYFYIKQHPEVFMAKVKEPRFFAYEGGVPEWKGPLDAENNAWVITDKEAYTALFNDVGEEKVWGEASPIYLYSEPAPERIKNYAPDAKLVAILRHPIERAYSHYLHLIRDNREPLRDFGKALDLESERMANGWEWSWHYTKVGMYSEQIQRYYDRFPREQVKVYLYDDLQTDQAGLIRDMFRFMGVDENFTPDTEKRYNVSGVPRSRMMYKFLENLIKRPTWYKNAVKPFVPKRIRKRLSDQVYNMKASVLEKPPLQPEVVQRLKQHFHEDIVKLQDLLERDLSSWLNWQPSERALSGRE